jgi:hypothetical protein
MADSRSNIENELEKPGRFPTPRASYLMWTRQQAQTVREIVQDDPEPEEGPEDEIANRFN